MNLTILNREFLHPTDGWYHVEAKGEHPNPAAGVVQVIDDEAAQSIVNRFNADAVAGKLRHGNEMLIDHEHFADDPNQESRAYGWLTKLQNRDDGIYGQIRWTKTGKEAVDGGDYRFFSTEYAPSDLKVLNKEATRVKPLRLDGLTLTNMNNNRGQKPITNRTVAGGATTFAGASASADSTANQPKEKTKMKTVCTLLGLSADADEASVHAAVTKLQNRITTLEPLEAENQTLKNRATEIETDACASLLDACGLKKDDKRRERVVPVLVTLKNREERLAYLADFDIKPVEASKPAAGKQQVQLHNRDTKAPGEKSNGTETDEQAKAVTIKNRAQELQCKGMKFGDAFAAATREYHAAQNK